MSPRTAAAFERRQSRRETQGWTTYQTGFCEPSGLAWFIVINSTVFLFGHACCFVIIIIDLLKFK
jgi:hypothetical protein